MNGEILFLYNSTWLMAGRPIYLLIFSMPSPRLELRTLADYSALIADSQ